REAAGGALIDDSHTFHTTECVGYPRSGLASALVGESHLIGALIGAALGDNERDVVVLFMRTVAPHFIDYGCHQKMLGQTAVNTEAVQQTFFPELVALQTARLRHSIGIQRQCVSREQSRLSDQAVPSWKASEHSSGGFEPLDAATCTHEKCG